jgi:LysM repeat protein
MNSLTARQTARTTARAVVVSAIALAGTALTYRLRPAAPSAGATPVADIVTGCGWLVWLLVGYLTVAVAATSLGHVIVAAGLHSGALRRLAPAGVRRLVDLTVTLSVAAAVLGTAGAVPAGAATSAPASSSHTPGALARGGLDWPGLSSPTARVGLVSAGAAASESSGHDPVVVQAGDSLWKIAARHLGPNATAPATAIAWQQWYVANRDVVGDDPDRIFPGQRLRPPQPSQHTRTQAATVQQTGSAR